MKGEIMEEFKFEFYRRQVRTLSFFMRQVLNRMHKIQKDLLVGIGDVISVGMINNNLAAVVPTINSDKDKLLNGGSIRLK